MAPREKLYYGDEVTAAATKAVELPDKIACKVCNKVKVPESFSKKELSDLRFMILKKPTLGKRDGARPCIRGNIRCRMCTGEQVNELTCYVCEETKGLGDFAKAQRRDPDAARCLKCVNSQLEEEPELDGLVIHDNDDDSEGSNPYNDNKGGSEDEDQTETDRNEFDSDEDGGVPTSSTLPTSGLTKQNLTSFDNATGSQNSKAYASKGKYTASEDDGSRVDVGKQAWNKSTQGGLDDIDGNVWMGHVKSLKGGTAYTGFDSQGNPHSRFRAPSTVASFTSTAPRSNITKTKDQKSSKFAQVRPTKLVPKFSTVMSTNNETRRALPKAEDPHDEDDEEFFSL